MLCRIKVHFLDTGAEIEERIHRAYFDRARISRYTSVFVVSMSTLGQALEEWIGQSPRSFVVLSVSSSMLDAIVKRAPSVASVYR